MTRHAYRGQAFAANHRLHLVLPWTVDRGLWTVFQNPVICREMVHLVEVYGN